MTDNAELQTRISELTRELAKDSQSKCFVALTDAYRQAGQLDDALEVALRGTWELPEYASGYAAVGRVYAQRQVYEKAATAFQRAIEADHRCLDAYRGMARLKREQGDLAVAASIVDKALDLFPNDATLKQMQASLPTVPTVAIDETAPTPRPVSGAMKPITTATIAEIYIEQGLYAQALEVYRELLDSAPQDASLQRKIAQIESLMRGEDSAKTIDPDPVAQSPVVPDPVALPTALPASASPGNSVLETLNGWLSAIQARRCRV